MAGAGTIPRVIVLADDLMWATRLAGLVRAAGAEPAPVRSIDRLSAALDASSAGGRFAVVDLTARGYEAIPAIAAAAGSGAIVLAVGQHDAVDERRAALDAGASTFLPYRRLAENGPALIRAWLDSGARTAAAGPAEATEAS